MNSIVLVKQVPDVADIPPDAWDMERGTLRRGALDSVLNPLDLHALTFAARLRHADSRIVCLTMGPPQAREILLDALARCADEAVLLCDRRFAGADTCATAYALAQAVRKISAEQFGQARYVIVAGMQSADGDTAQVPPQLAEEMGIEQIAYTESLSLEPELRVRRIGPHGLETVSPREYPVLLTVTDATQPLYRSFHRAREARRKSLHEWTAESVGADPERVGLKGSRTQVLKVFSPAGEQHRRCVMAADLDRVLDLMKTGYEAGALESASSPASTYDPKDGPLAYRGEVWVFAEQEDGKIAPVGLELVAKGRELADTLGEKLGVVLVGHGMSDLIGHLVRHGADRVYVAEDPGLRHFLPMPYTHVLARAVLEHQPQIMLFGATPLGRELAPRVAYRVRAGLTADCTRLEIGECQRDGDRLQGILKQTRPALGGNIMATIIAKNSRVQMATVRPGVMVAAKPGTSRTGEVVRLPPEVPENCFKTTVEARDPAPSGTRIAEADIIVSGGLGLGSKVSYDKYIRPLAESLAAWLGGRADVGASRSAVEEGFVGRDHQVGQTGQTVQPKLYVAVAISGAVQHISGMQRSGFVVAINKDPKAAIFKHADCGIAEDFADALPRLGEALRSWKSTS